MRITQLFAPGPYGGLERVVTQLSIGLARRGHQVTAVVLVEESARQVPDLVEDLAAGGVRVEVIRTPHRAYLEERRRVRTLLASIRQGVAHTHGYHADVMLRSMAQKLGLATVATVHGFTGGGRKNRLFEWLQRRSLRRMDAVIAVSDPVSQLLVSSGIPRPRIHVIRNAWAAPGAFLAREEARNRLGIDQGAKVVGWVGRVTPEKGPDIALSALAHAAPGLTLSFIGSGRLEPPLRELARQLGLESRVRWHGVVSDAWQYFRAFDAYCLSSHTEGTPIALLEAMAAGVPVVATRVGGVPDVVSEAEAFLVPPDDPRALAEALGRAVSEDQSHRTAQAAERLAREFSTERWLDRHEELYRAMTQAQADR